MQAQIATSTGALTIGGDALYGQHFAGRIDEVRIYSRALSANELQTDMNTPIGASGPPDTTPPTDPTGLIGDGRVRDQINLAWTGSTDNVAVAELPGRALPGREPVRPSSRSRPRPAPPTTTSDSRRRRPTATASAPPTRPAI